MPTSEREVGMGFEIKIDGRPSMTVAREPRSSGFWGVDVGKDHGAEISEAE